MSTAMKMPNNMFITVEGVDGVGKSTISRKLADLVAGVRICTPSERFSDSRRFIERDKSREDKFNFYTECIIRQQDEISRLLENSSVVCDRYIHSTFAYQWSLDVELPERINDYFKEIRVPDFSFLLIADDVVCRQRVLDREKSNGIINKADHAFDVINTASQRFMKMSELIKIDTNRKELNKICEEMMNLIKGLG